MPPLQVLRHEAYDCTVDWWCFGVLLFQLLTGELPFYDLDVPQLFDKICTNSVRSRRVAVVAVQCGCGCGCGCGCARAAIGASAEHQRSGHGGGHGHNATSPPLRGIVACDPRQQYSRTNPQLYTQDQRFIRKEGASEAAPEVVRQAAGGGCQAVTVGYKCR